MFVVFYGLAAHGSKALAAVHRTVTLGLEGNLGLLDIENVGPVIGAHCGPGTVALCFLGRERTV